LNLKCDTLVSKFAFQIQLVPHYVKKAGGFFDEARADANTHRDDRARDFGGGGGGGGSISMSGGVGLLGGMSGSSVMSDIEGGGIGGGLGASLLGGGGGRAGWTSHFIRLFCSQNTVQLMTASMV
jgi:hypothetical protein